MPQWWTIPVPGRGSRLCGAKRTLSYFFFILCFSKWWKLIAWPLNRPMKCPFYVLLIQSCQSFTRQITHSCILKEIAKEAPADLLRATVWCYHHHLKRIQSPHSLCRTVVWVINVSLSFFLWKPKPETAVHNLPGRICLFSEDNRGRHTCHGTFTWLMERLVKLLVACATGR